MIQPMHNSQTILNSSGGGSVRITIPIGLVFRGGIAVSNGAADGNGGSQPCRSCILIAATGVTTARVNIGAQCASNTGIPVVAGVYLPLRVDDLNLLYFFGSSSDVVDILWYN